MSRKAILTNIVQHDVKVLDEKDWPEGYTANRPNSDWELVEYANFKDKDGSPLRVWTPDYALKTPRISDFSRVRIEL